MTQAPVPSVTDEPIRVKRRQSDVEIVVLVDGASDACRVGNTVPAELTAGTPAKPLTSARRQRACKGSWKAREECAKERAANRIPVVRFGKGDRKLEVMRRHLAAQARTGRSGVAAIGVAQEFQNVFAAAQRQGSNGIPWFSFTKADRLSWRRGRIGSGRGRFDA